MRQFNACGCIHLQVVMASKKTNWLKENLGFAKYDGQSLAQVTSEIMVIPYQQDFRDEIFFLVRTGLRVSEMINLEVSDVDLEKNIIIVRSVKVKAKAEEHAMFPSFQNCAKN